MSDKLHIGDLAPDFRAVAVGGEYGKGREVSLRDFRAKPVVLYFYPKDDTPGCTTQACGIRDTWGEIKDRAALFGVSVDPPDSHQKFIDKFQLPFPLLSDSEQKIVNEYGVWTQKNFMGKKYMGVERTTFVIDSEGRISAIFHKVKPGDHVDLLKDALATTK
jgi:peroxiredoxin Q/BCP